MGEFIVERYWPGVTVADVRLASAALQAGQGDVRYLGSILMPEDEVALFRFVAASAEEVLAATEPAGLRCDRVVRAIFIGPDDGQPPAGGS